MSLRARARVAVVALWLGSASAFAQQPPPRGQEVRSMAFEPGLGDAAREQVPGGQMPNDMMDALVSSGCTAAPSKSTTSRTRARKALPHLPSQSPPIPSPPRRRSMTPGAQSSTDLPMPPGRMRVPPVLRAGAAQLGAWLIVASVLLTQQDQLTLAVGSKLFVHEHNFHWGDFAAAAILSGLPITVVFLLAQRWLIAGLVVTTGTSALVAQGTPPTARRPPHSFKARQAASMGVLPARPTDALELFRATAPPVTGT